MDAAGKNDVVTLPHQLAHTAVSRQRRRHRQAKFHIARGSLCQYIVHIFMQRLIIQAIEMAMGVD